MDKCIRPMAYCLILQQDFSDNSMLALFIHSTVYLVVATANHNHIHSLAMWVPCPGTQRQNVLGRFKPATLAATVVVDVFEYIVVTVT